MDKARYIVLTDINDGVEVDDIQSMHRLLLYSNEIDIEGLISCTSCFLKKCGEKNVRLIHGLIDEYGQVKDNLDVHAIGYPTADYLHSITCCGIPEFGKKVGKGFAAEKYSNNAGVKLIIDAVDKVDDRPLYIGLWGGANTLAQAVWNVWKTRSEAELNRFLTKLRIYGISDQDFAARWLRDNFGDRLFYIISPSKCSFAGSRTYYKATWPGISADNFKHGSEDGKTNGGFSGADSALVSAEWIEKNVRSKGSYGKQYPHSKFIMEGDTPTYLWLIPNGLNDPDHPEYGGWGGRYEFYTPDKKQFGIKEKHPIWTNANDTVIGLDDKPHTSPQATLWRWRAAFQNDFAMRMDWTISSEYATASHAPVIKTKMTEVSAKPGEKILLKADVSISNCTGYSARWYQYKEAGTLNEDVTISSDKNTAEIIVSENAKEKTAHIILEVQTKSVTGIKKHQRFIIKVV